MIQTTGISAITGLLQKLNRLPQASTPHIIGVDEPSLLSSTTSDSSTPYSATYTLRLRGGDSFERELLASPRITSINPALNNTKTRGKAREEIKVDNEENKEKEIRELKVIIAKLLAKELQQTYDKSKTQMDNLQDVVKKHAAGLENDDDLTTLIVFYSLNTRFENNDGHTGFFTRFPRGFLDHDNEHFESRVRILMKHLLIDIAGYDNALQIEKLRDFQPMMKAAKLELIDHLLSRIDLLKLTFPGYLEGENPLIRPWLAYQPGKWQGESGKELARKATYWMLKYGEGAIDEKGNYDVTKLQAVIESNAFLNPEYGTMGMLRNCPYTPNVVEAIRLALPKSIGAKPDQLHRWKIKYENKWEDPYLIDELTEYLIRYKLGCVDKNGNISKDKILAIKGLHQEYKIKECPDALKKSGLRTAYDAVKQRYPHLFGWRKEQIKPWEILQESLWSKQNGTRLFQQAFAYALWESGLGTFNSDAYAPVFSFTRSDFIEWYDSNFARNTKFIDDIVNQAGLSGPYNTIGNKSPGGAFEVLFGMAKEAPGKQRVRTHVLGFLRQNSNRCVVSFDPIDKSIRKEKVAAVLASDTNLAIHSSQLNFQRRNEIDRLSLNRYDLSKTRLEKLLEDASTKECLDRIKDLVHSVEDESDARFHCIRSLATETSNDEEFLRFLDILKISFIDDILFPPEMKTGLKELVESIQYVEGNKKVFLLGIAQEARKRGFSQTSYLVVLENTIGFLNEVLRDYDIKQFRMKKQAQKVKKSKKL